MSEPQVFMSHNWRDKDFVRKLALDLTNAGARVWIDEAEINVGDSLIEKIRAGIDQVDYLAVILSSNSVESEWVKKEVDIAMNQEIENRRVKVLPILLEPCNIPGFLKGKLYADFTSEEKYASGLAKLLKKLGLTSRDLPRFNTELLQECLGCIETFFSKEERDRALQTLTGRDAYSTGEWLLEKLTPQNESFWTGFTPTETNRMELLARIISEMGRLSWRAKEIRDNIIRQTDDSFGYDPEYYTWIQNRARAIYTSLKIIGDNESLEAINKRWPKGRDYT